MEFSGAETILERMDELKEYKKLGTVEQLSNRIDEENVLKFYYCESEDSYLIGRRIDTMYYAHWYGNHFTWDMSRYLPWGEHVVSPKSLWKEHTYPSEPKEIPFEDWLKGFVNKYFTKE